jgi:hypothetical protein
MAKMVMVEKVSLEALIEEVKGLRTEVRRLVTENDPLARDARELFIASAHGDRKAGKKINDIANRMKAEGKSTKEILELMAG